MNAWIVAVVAIVGLAALGATGLVLANLTPGATRSPGHPATAVADISAPPSAVRTHRPRRSRAPDESFPDEPTAEPNGGEPVWIGEGETLDSFCGDGIDGRMVKFLDDSWGRAMEHTRPVEVGGSVELVADVYAPNPDISDFPGDPSGAMLQWELVDGLGGRLSVEGCTATFADAVAPGDARVRVSVDIPLPVQETQPAPGEGYGESGPYSGAPWSTSVGNISVLGGSGNYSPPTSLCGHEWLSVSLYGPYSNSTNYFWISGPSTGYAYLGPFANRGTFQVVPGQYDIYVPEATGWTVNVPVCGYYVVKYDNQGWGEPLP